MSGGVGIYIVAEEVFVRPLKCLHSENPFGEFHSGTEIDFKQVPASPPSS